MWRARTLLAVAALSAGVAVLLGAAPQVPTVSAWARAAVADSGSVTRLAIPAIAVDSKVVEVGQATDQEPGWAVADFSVGHHEGSGVPGGGTNIVLAGHNNFRGEVFRRLDGLVAGDLVRLRTRDGAWHDYRVDTRRIVLEEGATAAQRHDNALLLAETEHEQVTLVTCWPYQPDPPYRLVVTALPVG